MMQPQAMPQSAPDMPQGAPPEAPQGAPQAEAMEKIQKILLAAKKFMYSPQTHQMFMKELQGKAPVPVLAGKAAAHVILYLFQLSKMQMNPQLVIPAGVLILAEIIDFMSKAAKIQVEDKVQEAAVKAFMGEVEQIMGEGQQPAEAPAQGQAPMQSTGLIGAAR